MTAIPLDNTITGHARELIKKSLGKKVRGKDNIVFRIKLFAEMLDGDQKAGWLLNQVIYWCDRTPNSDGWFWKTYTDWYEEIGLTEREIRRIVKGDKRRNTPKKTLQDVGVEIAVQRAPTGSPTMHYRINQALFFAALVHHLEVYYDLNLDEADTQPEAPNGQGAINAMVRIETDHCAVQNAAPSLDLTKITGKENQKESNLTPPSKDNASEDNASEDNASEDDAEIASLLKQEKRFGKIPEALHHSLSTEIVRLGQEKSVAVIERCIDSNGRSWFYVLKALKNEQICPETQKASQYTQKSATGGYGVSAWFDNEESYEEQRAHIKAAEEARWCHYPAVEPTERIQTQLNITSEEPVTAQSLWQKTDDLLKKRLGMVIYKLLLDGAILVDFNPKNETFIVVVRHLHNGNHFYQPHYRMIQQTLIDFYGSRTTDVRFLTRLDWVRYHKTISA